MGQKLVQRDIRINASFENIVNSYSNKTGYYVSDWKPFANKPVKSKPTTVLPEANNETRTVKYVLNNIPVMYKTIRTETIGDIADGDLTQVYDFTFSSSSDYQDGDKKGPLKVNFMKIDDVTTQVTVTYDFQDDADIIKELLENEFYYALNSLRIYFEAQEGQQVRGTTLN